MSNESKKQSKGKEVAKPQDGPSSDPAPAPMTEEGPPTAKEQAEAQKIVKELMQFTMRQKAMPPDPTKMEHRFWDTQPVPRITETAAVPEEEEGNIEPQKRVEDEPTEPYSIPDAYEWFTLDIKDPEQLESLYKLLAEHYVEDDDAMFRFNYPREFLIWALTPPGWFADWHIGVRVKKTGKLVAFISGIPVHIRVRMATLPMTEINFLCVHKAIRSKRLAPVLIKEVTRRVHLKNIWHAVYTAGIVLPRPIARCQYWHRSLNPPKLISIGFSRVPRQFEKFTRPMDAVKRHYALPDKPQIPGIRPLTEKDIPQLVVLLTEYLGKFAVAPVMDETEVKHWFLTRDGVINTFVVEKNGKLTDVASFYTLPSTVIGNQKYNELKAAYSFYNIATTVELSVLMTDALILAKKLDFDVFNALDIMENKTMLQDLKFGMGDGHLQYYLFNYRLNNLQPEDIGLVML